MGKIVKDEIDYSAPSAKRAVNVDYANSQSTLYSTNVQDAIDELSNRVWVGTQAEYNDLETYDDDTDYYITDAENEAFSASNVVFEPSSALNANNVQDAIEIVNSRVANPKASDVSYNNTNVQSALDSIARVKYKDVTVITSNTSDVLGNYGSVAHNIPSTCTILSSQIFGGGNFNGYSVINQNNVYVWSTYTGAITVRIAYIEA